MRRELPWETFFADKFQIDAAVGRKRQTFRYIPTELAEPAEEIEVAAFGETYRFSAESFFQGNRSMIDKLVETAIGDATGEIRA